MKKRSYDIDLVDTPKAEYVILQTANMNLSSKPPSGKTDNLALLLQESDSVTNFRRYLDSINSGHFLDFWFACQGFKNFDKSDSHKLNQLMKVIYRAYIKSESPFAVPLKSNTKKLIVDKLSVRKTFDPSIFDIAQSEIRDILANEFLVKFFKSEFYTDPNMFDRCSLSSTNNNNMQLSEVPLTSSSSTGYMSRRFLGPKFLGTPRNAEAIMDGNVNKVSVESPLVMAYTAQNSSTVTSGFNNSYLGANGGSTSSKDRRNLSEVDPPAFAKVLSTKLEEVFVEQTKFDKILRLVKSGPNESDTDDSHSSAISYLMKCQVYSPQCGNCCSVEGDLVSDHRALLSNVSCKMKSMYCSGDPSGTDFKDDYAQGILESHCSRIGVDLNESKYSRRDSSEVRSKLKRECDLGSITSYDSGVATSLEQYSNLGIPSHLLETIYEWHKNSSKNMNPVEVGLDSHRYHHHHHHHHHKNHSDCFQKGFLAVNNLSDVSSNFDSGISSTYENMGRRFQPTDDKVSTWMSKNPKVTSKTSYNFTDSFLTNITSGIPPNTPLISTRGISSLPPLSDNYPNQPYFLQRCYSNKVGTPLPESGILPCQNIENWLEQQDNGATMSTDFYRHDYCSSTVGVAGSDLLIRESFCHRDQRSGEAVAPQPLTSKDQPPNFCQSSRPKVSGPLVIGYYIGNDPVPYRSQIPDTQQITLGQFKSLIAKKGPFRYFFKRYCDEFECGAVHEEITRDDAVLPLWEGKVVAKIEKAE